MTNSQFTMTAEDQERLAAVQAWKPPRQIEAPPTPPAAVAPTQGSVPAPAQASDDEGMPPMTPCPHCGARPEYSKWCYSGNNEHSPAYHPPGWWCSNSICQRFRNSEIQRLYEERQKRLPGLDAAVAKSTEESAAKIGQRQGSISFGPGRVIPAAQASPAISAGPPAFGFQIP